MELTQTLESIAAETLFRATLANCQNMPDSFISQCTIENIINFRQNTSTKSMLE